MADPKDPTENEFKAADKPVPHEETVASIHGAQPAEDDHEEVEEDDGAGNKRRVRRPRSKK
jgi:hypothetical protein